MLFSEEKSHRYNDACTLWVFFRFEKKTLSSTDRAAGGVVGDGERCREISFNAGGISFLHLKSYSLNAT